MANKKNNPKKQMSINFKKIGVILLLIATIAMYISSLLFI